MTQTRLSLLAVVIGLLLCSPMARPRAAQESVSLTTPIAQNISTIALRRVILDVTANVIVVEWNDNTGKTFSKQYDGTTSPTGATLLHTLNTANFSVNSLVKQVYNRLLADGAIPAGSVSGTAQ